jgi:hypothetical protein
MSGVDIDAGNRLVDLIKPITAMTRRAGCAEKGMTEVRRLYAFFRQSNRRLWRRFRPAQSDEHDVDVFGRMESSAGDGHGRRRH